MTDCVHRYRFPEPDGRAKLPGVCQLCGFTVELPSGSNAGMQWQRTDGGMLGLGVLRDPRYERERARGAPKEARR